MKESNPFVSVEPVGLEDGSPPVSLENVSVGKPLAKIELVKADPQQDMTDKQTIDHAQDLAQLSVPRHESWANKIEAVYGSAPAVYHAYALHDLAAVPGNSVDGITVLRHAAALRADPVYQENLAEVDSVVFEPIVASAAAYISAKMEALRAASTTAPTTAEVQKDFAQVSVSAARYISETSREKGIANVAEALSA